MLGISSVQPILFGLLDFFEAFSKGSTPFEDVHNSPAWTKKNHWTSVFYIGGSGGILCEPLAIVPLVWYWIKDFITLWCSIWKLHVIVTKKAMMTPLSQILRVEKPNVLCAPSWANIAITWRLLLSSVLLRNYWTNLNQTWPESSPRCLLLTGPLTSRMAASMGLGFNIEPYGKYFVNLLFRNCWVNWNQSWSQYSFGRPY